MFTLRVKVNALNLGLVFINGRNLGRYWYIGPQQTLYIPKTFWNRRDYNTVVVFEEIQGIVSN